MGKIMYKGEEFQGNIIRVIPEEPEPLEQNETPENNEHEEVH